MRASVWRGFFLCHPLIVFSHPLHQRVRLLVLTLGLLDHFRKLALHLHRHAALNQNALAVHRDE